LEQRKRLKPRLKYQQKGLDAYSWISLIRNC